MAARRERLEGVRVLDVPAAKPARERCDTCGFPADRAVVSADGVLSVACLRDRVTLPVVDGGQHLERRFGRWYAGRVGVEQVLGSALALDCENCTAPGEVVYRLTTPDGQWETVACRDCLPPRLRPVAGRSPAGAVVQQALARRVRGVWRAAPERWWPAPSGPASRRPPAPGPGRPAPRISPSRGGLG